MPVPEAQATREAIEKVFTLSGVKRVICIDDDYSRGPDIEDIIALCVELKATIARSIPEFAAFSFDADDDVWKAQLRGKWPELDVPTQRRIGRELSAGSTQEQPAPAQAVHRLAELMPAEPTFLEMTWSEWRQKKSQLLEEAKTTPTLLLVDQDLSAEGGSADEGIKVIADILQTIFSDDVICGLLSQTFGPGEEHDKELSKNNFVGRICNPSEKRTDCKSVLRKNCWTRPKEASKNNFQGERGASAP